MILAAAASGCGGAVRAPAEAPASCPDVIGVPPEIAGEMSLAAVDAYIDARGWRTGGAGTELVEIATGPALRNARQVQQSILKRYPPQLRAAGIGGTVVLRLLVGTAGRASEAAVLQGSGHAELDRAAHDVVREMRFAPQLRQGCAIRVLIDVPVQLWVQ